MNLGSGYPFWLIKNGLPYNYPMLDRNIETDVLIAGGGISGALTAYCLRAAGIACVLLDGRTIGLGSTCASTALLQYELDTSLSELSKLIGPAQAAHVYQLSEQSIRHIAILAKETNTQSFQPRNSIYCAFRKKDLTFLEEEFKARSAAGIAVQWLSQSDLKNEYGLHAHGAIRSDSAATLDVYAFTHNLLQSARKNGLEVFDRSPITTVKTDDSGICTITASGNRVKARILVYATGYETANLLEKGLISLHSTYACISEQFNSAASLWKDEALIWNTQDPYLYMRTTLDRRILIGGRDEDFLDPQKRDRLIAGKAKKLAKDFNKLFPNIPFKAEFSWCGTFGTTADGMPLIGKHTGHPHCYFNLGMGGNGIIFSMLGAELLREEILGNKPPELSHFAFNRPSLKAR
jgi:glycine/D-amino acid oxidase-like deaminating enzyme